MWLTCRRRRRRQRRRRHSVSAKLSSLVAAFALFSLWFADFAYGFAAGDPPGAKDWMNSPLVGGGNVPDGSTDLFFTAYLDRILYLDEQRYTFAVSMYVFLSWIDTRAPEQLKNATAETTSGTRDCARVCVGQRAPSETSLCCDTIWLPSFIIRNADEMPQGRLQPYYITVADNGVVTWRVEFRSNFYTTLDVQSFPWDFQDLRIVFQLINLPGTGRVRVIPSARGLHLFSLGRGDDLSSFKTTSLHIDVSTTPFSKQFDRFMKFDTTNNNSIDAAAAAAQAKARDQVEARSDPRDPAPLVPALVPDPADRGKVAPVSEPFGTDIEVVNVVVVIVVKRLWQYYVISAIVPILTATLLSFVVFAVPPPKLDTRLQTAIALFLSLLAVQYIIEDALPKSSYVIPTRMLVLASYVCLGLIAIESLVVFNLWHWPEVRSRLAGRREAVRKHSEITRLRMLLQQSRARSGGGGGGGGGGGSGRGGGGGNGKGARSLVASVSRRLSATKGTAGNSDGNGSDGDGRAGWTSQLMTSMSRRRTQAVAAAAGIDGGNGVGVGGGGGGGGSRRITSAGDEPRDIEGNIEGASSKHPPLVASPAAAAAAAAAAAGQTETTTTTTTTARTEALAPSSSTTAATRNAANTMLLEEELEKALWHYRAWKVDVISFWVVLFAYLISAVLIFGGSVLASRRAAAAAAATYSS